MTRLGLIALLTGLAAAPAAAQDQLWIRQFGTSAGDSSGALAPDGAGGAFVAGSTSGSLFGPYAGGYPLGGDVFLARYDSAGNGLWNRQFGTNGDDYADALAADGAGGMFVAGGTWGTLGGSSAGSNDAWLARYDGAGNQTWIRQFGTSYQDEAYAVATDGAGGAFVAGFTGGSLVGANAGSVDAWLARYDGAGNQTWIRQLGTSGPDYAFALIPDGEGGAFVAGSAFGSLGGPYVGLHDAWLARYDSGGNRAWIRQLGTSGYDLAGSFAPDGTGGVFVAGNTQGNLGGTNAGGYDAWLARYGTACYPNCDASTAAPILNIADFTCFLTKFASGDPYANCDQSTMPPILNIADFTCFLQKYASGCP
jgi:hypothetical protein